MADFARRPSLARALIGISERLRFQHVIRTGRTQMENDTWHRVGDVGEPPFGNAAFQAPSDPPLTVSYRMLPSGFIVLRGRVVASDPLILPTSIFTLPDDWRPYETELHCSGGRRGAARFGVVIGLQSDGLVGLRAIEDETNLNWAQNNATIYFDTLLTWAGP